MPRINCASSKKNYAPRKVLYIYNKIKQTKLMDKIVYLACFRRNMELE